jgi:phage virion morphogenesis protein
MTAFTITIQDQAVQSALKALADRAVNLQPVMKEISERMLEDASKRFGTGTGPDGVKWKENSIATLQALSDRLGKGYRKKNGTLNSEGHKWLADKKVLVDTEALMGAFKNAFDDNSLTITNTKEYAAIHQYGGKAGRGHKTTITARPFLPVKPDGTLYPQEQATVLDELNNWLINGR